jgi:3-oxocholest-4-en-26-oyl-CoA dehydrogenase beta subunit
MVGGARAVLDLTVRYITDRVQFGRPIGSFQAVQHHVADLSTRIDAAGLAAWQAVWRCSLGSDANPDAGGLEAAVAIAKVAAGDAYVETTLMAHQLHGWHRVHGRPRPPSVVRPRPGGGARVRLA